ncbi:adenylyl-sulfate kinase [Tepidibacillus decaturensis]|uniref:APS kinase domain-containing protein n=1 Tax=Tepidibacillus decaturensis TaxID=1413211 RepID=A0A135L5L6_9BACI|nr:adenylyl-sulfate kinase [Tepidibacillus decaturensis]KXG44276.1 hypothetical protein U473_09870 [Tepidibacillus decaturensis]
MQQGLIIWFTGHSKSGKTTLSKLLFSELQQKGYRCYRLDSDTLPLSIIKPQADRWEERQRLKLENISFLSRLLYDNNYFVLIASVGRFSEWRELLRKQVPNFIEIYLTCPLEVRLERDFEKNIKLIVTILIITKNLIILMLSLIQITSNQMKV